MLCVKRGFTITELLVVIVIFVLVVGVSVPSFKGMLESSEQTLAENQLRVGLSSARDAAVQSPSSDAAAVFFFQPNGRISIVTCVSVGFLIDDEVPAGQIARTDVKREVFVPLPTTSLIQLPKNYSVRAYTPSSTVSGSNNDPLVGDANGWYESIQLMNGSGSSSSATAHWVFPETHFFDQSQTGSTLAGLGWQRQSFMVRFKNGTGELDSANRSLAIVIDPISAQSFRVNPPFSTHRLDQKSDLAAAVRQYLEATNLTGSDLADRIKVLGDVSIDSVLVRPVTELAVYDERKLIAGLAAVYPACDAPNRVTGTVYADPATTATTGPKLDENLFAGPGIGGASAAIDRWIEGRLSRGAGAELVESDARIFTLQRYLGQLQELQIKSRS
jgi:prepilin-type N-terminal cleavage/methylation domain-containing protein